MVGVRSFTTKGLVMILFDILFGLITGSILRQLYDNKSISKLGVVLVGIAAFAIYFYLTTPSLQQ